MIKCVILLVEAKTVEIAGNEEEKQADTLQYLPAPFRNFVSPDKLEFTHLG